MREKESLKEFLVQERIALYIQEYNRSKVKEPDNETDFREYLQREIPEKAPQIIDKFIKYMDEIGVDTGNRMEGIYIMGLQDGIQIMKEIMQVKPDWRMTEG